MMMMMMMMVCVCVLVTTVSPDVCGRLAWAKRGPDPTTERANLGGQVSDTPWTMDSSWVQSSRLPYATN